MKAKKNGVAETEPVFEFINTGDAQEPQMFIDPDDSIEIVEKGSLEL